MERRQKSWTKISLDREQNLSCNTYTAQWGTDVLHAIINNLQMQERCGRYLLAIRGIKKEGLKDYAAGQQ